jgi:hypothetical protein
MAKKWIQKMHMKKGALHRQLGVPAGKKIPAGKLAAAAKKGGTLGRRARLAKTLKGLHGGNTVVSANSMKGQSMGNRAFLLKEKAAFKAGN